MADIVEKKGKIERLIHPQISNALQERYLKLLNEFIRRENWHIIVTRCIAKIIFYRTL